jgi:uncharacterized protein (TIGR02246 family)
MRHLFVAGLPLILLLACSPARSSSELSPTDRGEIEQIPDSFAAAWNRHDMRAMSALFTEDADFVVITGRHLKGREDIFSYHDSLHRTVFKTRQLAAELKDLRPLRPDVAIGHLAFQGWDVSGDESRRTSALATIVVKRAGDIWAVSAFHNTLVTGLPGGGAPTGADRPK